MLINYYTLRALVSEWNSLLRGARLVDAYSQHKGSLLLVFECALQEDVFSLNVSLQAPSRHVFLYQGSNRARKNVVDHFPQARNEVVSSVSIADGDRIVTLSFSSGRAFVIVPFGPRANVFYVDGNRSCLSTFKGKGLLSVPSENGVEMPKNASALESHLRDGKSLKSMIPLFPPPLVAEILHRTGGTEDPVKIFDAICEIDQSLTDPAPRLYWDADRRPLLSLVELRGNTDDEEKFSTVTEAARVCARRRLALARLEGTHQPLIRMLKNRRDQAERSLTRVTAELGKPSRADLHEKRGHLLMAQPHLVDPQKREAVLADILGDGSEVVIKLDHRLNVFENAQVYFEKAKTSRAARASALKRVDGLRNAFESLHGLLEEARTIENLKDVQAFQSRNESVLKALRSLPDDPDAIPYRRYALPGGYEVWVGRNAKQNDQLTLRDSRKFDFWLHARGVAGSHVVLRVKGRGNVPPASIVEQAAAIAAWHSKARTSALAPVIVTERKYVRKPRKSLPGTVVVEREKVIMIEPALPSG